MDLEDIKLLIDVTQRLGLAELEASKNGVTLRLVREAAPDVSDDQPLSLVATASVPKAAPRPVSQDLLAPLSGVLHLSPAPGAAPFATPGQAIKRGDTLCVIEAMKVFNQVSAERDGVVAAVLLETGVEVEAGQTVMHIT
jgi:acetyl-CoA carboxylase biotin carboxyl carrier protein